MAPNNEDEIVAMDCEFVGGAADKDLLGRVSIVDGYGRILCDLYVKPTETVLDYRTQISGITAAHLKDAKDITEIRQIVKNHITGKYLVGHGVENDLLVIEPGFTVPKKLIRDTGIYRFLRNGLKSHRTPKLSDLAKIHLDKAIHNGVHDSVEDARVALEIYKKYKVTWERNLANYLKNFDKANFSSGYNYRGDDDDICGGFDCDYEYYGD